MRNSFQNNSHAYCNTPMSETFTPGQASAICEFKHLVPLGKGGRNINIEKGKY